MDSEQDRPYGGEPDAIGEGGLFDDPGMSADAPVDGDGGPIDAPLAAAAEPEGRLVLGTLAGLGVVLLGIVAWSLLYAFLKRDYVGVSVVFALGIGYVVREVSRRSDLVPRIVSAVLAAVLCVLGSTVALVANTVREYPSEEFFPTLRHTLPKTFTILSNRNALTWGIFAAAVVVAFLSAADSKPKKATVAPASDDLGDEPADGQST